LQTRATVDGDDFVSNGQKICTSTAHEGDMIFCLVRTEPDKPKHEGLPYLIFSMKTPGVEVRPLTTMTGPAEFNEVFFTDVRVPRSQIAWQRGRGSFLSNSTLTDGPGTLGARAGMKTRSQALVALMQEETVDGPRAIDNPIFRDRLIRLRADL